MFSSSWIILSLLLFALCLRPAGSLPHREHKVKGRNVQNYDYHRNYYGRSLNSNENVDNPKDDSGSPPLVDSSHTDYVYPDQLDPDEGQGQGQQTTITSSGDNSNVDADEVNQNGGDEDNTNPAALLPGPSDNDVDLNNKGVRGSRNDDSNDDVNDDKSTEFGRSGSASEDDVFLHFAKLSGMKGDKELFPLANFTYYAIDLNSTTLPKNFRAFVQLFHKISAFREVPWKKFNQVCEDYETSDNDPEGGPQGKLSWKKVTETYIWIAKNQKSIFQSAIAAVKGEEVSDDMGPPPDYGVGRVVDPDAVGEDLSQSNLSQALLDDLNNLDQVVRQAWKHLVHDVNATIKTKQNVEKLNNLTRGIMNICSPLDYLVCISPQGFVQSVSGNNDHDDHDDDHVDGNHKHEPKSADGYELLRSLSKTGQNQLPTEGHLPTCGCRDNFMAVKEKCYVKQWQDCNLNNLFLEPDMERLPAFVLSQIPQPKCAPDRKLSCLNSLVCYPSRAAENLFWAQPNCFLLKFLPVLLINVFLINFLFNG